MGRLSVTVFVCGLIMFNPFVHEAGELAWCRYAIGSSVQKNCNCSVDFCFEFEAGVKGSFDAIS